MVARVRSPMLAAHRLARGVSWNVHGYRGLSDARIDILCSALAKEGPTTGTLPCHSPSSVHVRWSSDHSGLVLDVALAARP